MGLRFKQQSYGDFFFVTTTFTDWNELGNIPGIYEVLGDSLIHYSIKYDAKIIGYVFMPSHIHLLLLIDGSNLSKFMRDYKKYTSQKSIKECGISMKNVWKPRYDRVTIYSDEVLKTKLNYIHNNPVKAKVVNNIEDWKWSSYNAYNNKDNSPIPISKQWY